jgi:pantoate--beta-alanine ligase
MEDICSIVSAPLKMHKIAKQWILDRHTIGYVPTMGCLHEGHLSLIKEARRRTQKVVVSIFVNPLQFSPTEDFNTYPKSFERDLEFCKKAGVDVIFHPKSADLYPRSFQTNIDGGLLSKKYCGKTRPGHFNGVLTVVHILLELIKPTLTFLGEKDFQQSFLIKQMCCDLWLPTEIIVMPIIREKNGLAMSSRNAYLNPEQKENAACLFHAILSVQNAVKNGYTKTSELLALAASSINHAPGMQLDYAHFVNSKTLLLVGDNITPPTRLLLAAYVGDNPRVRLIDNGHVMA